MRRALPALLLTVAACASRPPHASGYLGDYSGLKQSASDPDLWEWRHPGADFKVYDKLVVEPVLIRLAEGSSPSGEAIHQTAEELRAALVAGASPRWKVVPRGGPGALRMQVVLVAVMPGAIAYEAEIVDTVTASRLVKLVRKVAWPSSTIAPL